MVKRCPKCGRFISDLGEHTCPEELPWKKWTKEKVIKELKSLSEEIEITRGKLKEIGRNDLIGACCRYFGSWNAAKKKAGLKTWYEKRSRKVECDYCGKEFNKKLSEVKESNHNFCSQDCCHKWMKGQNNPMWKPKVTKTCKQCGKEFKVYPNKKDRSKFCSRECEGKYRTEENCPAWKGGKITKKCEYCGKKFKVTPARKDEARFCSHECFNKWRKENLDKIKKPKIDNSGKNNPFYGKTHSKETIRKIIKNRDVTPPTKPEKRLIKIIKEYKLNWRYVGDGKLIIHGLNPDFIGNNGNSKKIIEIFGRYWHQGRENVDWKRTEFGRKAIFSQLGYETLIIWDDEMREMSDEEVTNKINSWDENYN